jgi:hypothetical protein
MKSFAVKQLATLLTVALIFGLSGCYIDWDGEPCVRARGRVFTELRQLPRFTGVEVQGDFEVYLTQSPVSRCEVEADDRWLPYIFTEVRNGKLVIYSERCLRGSSPVKIYLSTDRINDLIMTGSGLIYGENIFRQDYLNVRLVGSGKIDVEVDAREVWTSVDGSGIAQLAGYANNGRYDMTGSGSIRAFDLRNQFCYATLSGSGSIDIWAERSLDVVISGSGTVRYAGNPSSINQRISGSGRLIRF